MGEENSMGPKLPGMLLSLLIILKVSGSTEASCSLSGSTADCRNLNLTSVPQNLPTGITYLDLRINHIATLSQSDFSRYRSLTELRLSYNRIATISPQAFYSLSDLVSLYLNGNRLSNLSTDMFTGLGNLQSLYLHNNEISDIQTGTFSSTSQLRTLQLNQNNLTNLRSDTFTGLGNLKNLYLHNNEISDIQAGTFNSSSQLVNLFLQYNRLTILNAEIFTELSSPLSVNIDNNPWQCDCRMLPFRQKMTGSHSFENQITCEKPSNFRGQKLIDISPEDLIYMICEEPTIARFEMVHNYTVVEGGSLHLVCESSGIPTPDITVTLPSGLNVTVESDERVTVGVNGSITITSVTAADAGLYACVAASPVGSAFATLVVHVQLTTTGTEAPATFPAFTIPVPVFIGTVCAPVAGTVLIGAIVFTIWHKRKAQNPSSDPTPPVFSNASANVTITGHDQTGQGGDQATSDHARSSEHVSGRAVSQELEYEDVVLPPRKVRTSPNSAGLIQQPEYLSLEPRNRAPSDELPPHDQTEEEEDQATTESLRNARSSEHVPGRAVSQDIEYEDVLLPPRNVRTSPNGAGLIEQPEYLSLEPRNRAPNDELPPLPSNRNKGGPTGAHGTPHYYQSLKKKT